MKRIIKLTTCLLLLLTLFTPVVLKADDENGGLDFGSNDQSDSDYNGIDGSYDGFDFFSTNNSEKIEKLSKKEKSLEKKNQENILRIKPKEKDYSYFDKSLFDSSISTYSSNDKAIDSTNNQLMITIYIFIGCLVTLFLLLVYLRYKNKVRKEVSEYETNNHY